MSRLRPGGRDRWGGVVGPPTDAVLIDRVRSGDPAAYAVLYERHGPTARRFARSLVRTEADADDVVAEVFAGILMALEHGKGPVGSFAPYLMSSVRNECARLHRRDRRESPDRFDPVDGDGCSVIAPDPYDRLDEVAVLRVAFASLPDHQREVLWNTEVDEVAPTELADRNGSTPHAMAMTAMRARRALGSAYLDQHVTVGRPHHDLEADCRDALPHLVGYVRGTLGVRRRRRVEAHLERCEPCDDARDGLGRLNRQLRVLPILPIDAGAALGIKAQVLGWFSAHALPMAASGVLAVSALSGPMVDLPPRSPDPAADGGIESPGTASFQPTATPAPDDQALAPQPATSRDEPSTPTPTPTTSIVERPISSTPAPVEARAEPSPSDAPPADASLPAETTPSANVSPSAPVAALAPAAVATVDTVAPAAVSEPPTAPSAEPTAAAPDTAVAADTADTAVTAGADVDPPPGQLTNNGNGGTPPGQLVAHLDHAATPPGRLATTGHAAGPPGLLTSNGDDDTAATPPGQLTNNGRGNGDGHGNAGTPTETPAVATD